MAVAADRRLRDPAWEAIAFGRARHSAVEAVGIQLARSDVLTVLRAEAGTYLSVSRLVGTFMLTDGSYAHVRCYSSGDWKRKSWVLIAKGRSAAAAEAAVRALAVQKAWTGLFDKSNNGY